MRGLNSHRLAASQGTAIGNAVGRPHEIFIESGVTCITQGYNTVFAVNSDATYHSIRTDDSIDFYLGTDKWTFECYVYIPSGGNSYGLTRFLTLWKTGGQELFLMNWTGTQITFLNVDSGVGDYYSYTGNSWLHVAFTRSGSTLRFYVNGNLINTDTIADNYTGTHIDLFGIYGEQDPYPDDFKTTYWVDDIRLTKNELVYTGGSFTPPPRQTIYNTANTMVFLSNCSSIDDTTTGSQEVVIAPGYAPAGYVTIDL